MKEGKNLLSVKLMNQEINTIYTVIQIIYLHLGFLKNKYNKINYLPGLKENEQVNWFIKFVMILKKSIKITKIPKMKMKMKMIKKYQQ